MVVAGAVAVVLAVAGVSGLVSFPEAALALVALGLIAVAIGVVLSVFIAAIGWLTGAPE